MTSTSNLTEVVCQAWEESERGWGVRPDGYSLHLNDSDRQVFIADYWAGMPDEVPDEYSRPVEHGTVLVKDSLYKRVAESDRGIRIYRTEADKLYDNEEVVPIRR